MQTKKVSFTFNRGGYYYFTRRIPKDLKHHYKCKRIVQGLRTSSSSIAKSRAMITAAKLDEYWSHLRMTDTSIMGKHMLKLPHENLSLAVTHESISIEKALHQYRSTRGKDKGKTFHQASERACRYLISAVGAKNLHEYSRADALAFRDYLLSKGLAGSSVTRVFNTLISVVNFAISENAIDLKNPFIRVYHDRNAGVITRLPIPVKTISEIQSKCISIDDDMRWLIALLSDTGMRLGEAVGLLNSDIITNHETPHVIIQPHPWRRLKTASSSRKVPLVGMAFWSAKRILENNTDNLHAFSRYNKSDLSNANSASSGLNKWMRNYVDVGCSIHSFRHSMRDRLRAVDCPMDMIDQIGGWSTKSIGQKYGNGYNLKHIKKYLELIELEFE
jgi:integrase